MEKMSDRLSAINNISLESRNNLTAIQMILSIMEKTNEVIDNVNLYTDTINNKFDTKDLDKLKIGMNGNFIGTWFGMMPSETDQFSAVQLASLARDMETVFMTAERFGIIGDGMTDVTTGFIQAMQYAEEKGRLNLYVPGGDYLINGYFEIPPNTEIYIKFDKNARIVRSDESAYYFCTCGQTKGKAGYGGGCSNLTIEGGTFQDGKYSISLNHASNCTFKNMYFNNSIAGGHIFDLMGCDQIEILDCTFEGRDIVAGRVFTEAIQIDGSTEEGGSNNFINCDYLPSKNITVNGCRFLPTLYSDGHIKYFAPNPIGSHTVLCDMYYKNINFTNNYVQDCNNTSTTDTGGWIRFYGVDDLYILNNKFVSTHETDARIVSIQNKLEDGVNMNGKNIFIRGNFFSGMNAVKDSNTKPVISITGDAESYCRNISITENIFSDCYGFTNSATNPKGADLISVSYCSNISALNNQATDIRRLFYASTCKNVNVSSNTINNSHIVPVYATASEGVVIVGNCANVTSAFVYTSSCKNITVSSNTINGLIDDSKSSYGAVIAFKDATNVTCSNNVASQGSGSYAVGILINGVPANISINQNWMGGIETPTKYTGSISTVVIDTISRTVVTA